MTNSIVAETIADIQKVIQSLDQKAIFVLAAAGIASKEFQGSTTLEAFAEILLFLSFVSSAVAVWPRSKSRSGELSWPTIKQMTDTELVGFLSESGSEESGRYAKRLKSLSEIAERKTLFLRFSLVLLSLALVGRIVGEFCQ